MSVRVSVLVWDTDLPPSEKLVGLALADNSNNEGECWPSLYTLCQKTGLSRRTVQRAIRDFEDAGWLVTRQEPGGRRYFQFTERFMGGCHSDTPSRVTVTPGGCHGDTPHSITVNEPSVEPSAKADGGAVVELSAVDVVKVVFDTGVLVLTASGQTPAKARSIVGRWRKTYSDSVVMMVLARCQIERPSEPIEWIAKALQQEQGKSNGENGTVAPSGDSIIEIGRRVAERMAGQTSE